MPGRIEFRVLGPLEVRAGVEPLALGGPRQRALLAILLLSANRVVSRDRLIEELVADQLSADADHTVRVQISRLRKALATADDEPRLVTRAPGYLLRVEPDEFDLHRFDALVAEGRRALEAGEVKHAAVTLREAESLWRGRPLADLEFEPFARLEIERLEELRLAAIEDRLEAELALGQHASVVPELELLVADNPLRERLRAQLMVALYRAGRQAEALEFYRAGRSLLVEELALEPSPRLKELEQAILRHDENLELAGSPIALLTQPRPKPPARTSEPSLPSAQSRSRKRRWLVGVTAVAAASAAAAVAVVLATGESPARLAVSNAFAVALLDSRSGEVIGTAPAVSGASLMRAGEGLIWDKRESGLLLGVDPRTLQVTRSIAVGPTIGSFAVGGAAIWMLSGDARTLLRLDARYGVVTRRIKLPRPPKPAVGAIAESGGVALGAGSLWVAHGLAEVDRIDPVSGHLQHRFRLHDANAVAFGGGSAWVASSDLGRISKIDPTTNAVVATARIRPWICCLTYGGGFVWASNNERVWKLSETGEVLDTVKTLSETGDIAFGAGALWFTNDAAGTVTRVDAQTGATRQLHLGHTLTGIAASGHIVAVSVSPTIADLLRDLRGKVLQIRFSQDWIDDTDPAVGGAPGTNEWPWLQQLSYATSARLLNYRDAPAPEGWKLVPEVAAALPSVSRDGRTYTLQIRPGFRFSPPSNQPVTASTFKYSIERALSPQLGANAPAAAVASDIVGVRAFRQGRATHISGIQARGQRLAITLVRRGPDFPERIALSYFAAVPIGTPIVPNGLRDPIPSAGPYYVSANGGGIAAVVRRNPNYGGSRPQNLDAIVYRNQPQIGDDISAIEAGRADYIAEPDSTLASGGVVARKYARASDGQPNYVRTPMLATDELVFNTRNGIFASARLRRAVNVALDRPALAAALGDLVTDRALPPGIPGFTNRHAYPLHPLNLARVRAAEGVPGGRAVLAVCSEPACLAVGRLVAAELARVGIHIKLRRYEGPIASSLRRTGADIVLARAYTPYPDPVAALRAALGDTYRRQLDAIGLRDRGQRLHAAQELELSLLRNDAPVAPIGNPTIPELFSARVGCVTFQPLFLGVDLASLCLRG